MKKLWRKVKANKLVLAAVIFLIASCQAQANEGFYIMFGAGYNDSLFNDGHHQWQDGDEVGTDFGLGYRFLPVEEISVDLSFRHKSQLNYNSGCDYGDDYCESTVDSFYVDIYWFPGKRSR